MVLCTNYFKLSLLIIVAILFIILNSKITWNSTYHLLTYLSLINCTAHPLSKCFCTGLNHILYRYINSLFMSLWLIGHTNWWLKPATVISVFVPFRSVLTWSKRKKCHIFSKISNSSQAETLTFDINTYVSNAIFSIAVVRMQMFRLACLFVCLL